VENSVENKKHKGIHEAGKSLQYRGRQAKWDREHLRTVTTKMTRRKYEIFKRDCEAERTTPYALLGRLIAEWMGWR
jgi:hypothetical protein